MANNIAVSVTADTGGLVAGMAVAKVAMQDYGKEVRALARAVADGDTSKETKARLFEVSEAYAKTESTVALYRREIGRAQTANVSANDNAGQLRAGMQNLGFQLQDVAVQFASGQRAGTIFAQQLPQVAGALTQMAQAGGNATGILGRFASFMSGPWGVAVGVSAAVLGPFIGKLFETGTAADQAKDKVYGLQQAIADMRTKPMEAQGKLQEKISTAEGALSAALNMPRYTGAGSEQYKRNTYLEQVRSRAIDKAELDLAAARADLAVGQLSAQNYDKLRVVGSSAGRARAFNIKDDDGESGKAGGSKAGGGKKDNDAARAGQIAADAEIQAKQAANQQIEALAADRYQTEAQLSEISIRTKLDDIEAEQRAGAISAAQAIRLRADADAQIARIDSNLQAKLFNAKLDQLEADRRLHKEKTEEYNRYTQQIDALKAKHLNRQMVLDQKDAAQKRAASKQAETAEAADMQRAEEQKRAAMERTFGPFSQSLARMLTLQRGFVGTMRDLWGNLVGVVEQAVARMIQSFLIGLLTQEAAGEATNRKLVASDASAAASGAYKAVVGIPIIGPILAPIAAATAYAGVMAFSAEDGWDVPGGGGAGIDGRGGRPAIIHPREMVLPAQIADSVRALPNGLAGATAATASLRGASASVADINGGAFSSPQIRNRGGQAGSRRSRSGNSGTGGMTVNINAVDARGVKRLFMDHNSDLAAALRKHVRDGGRG